MHVCFHGGAVCDGGGRLAKSFNVISDFTKILIRRRDGDHARARRRRQMRRCKDAAPAAAAAAAVASAKIAPAQLQEEEGDGGGGGKEEEFCDKCCSALSGAGDAEEAAVTATEGEREWVAEPEPGVLLTLAPRADGVSNRLRRIRFREEVFDAWAAQCWWADNHDRIAELYCLVQPDDEEEEEIASAEAAMLPATPCQSEAEEEEDDGAAGAESSSRSPSTSTFSGGPSSGSGGGSTGTLGSPILGLVTNTGAAAAGAEHDAVRDQQPTAAPWTEWVEEYEPGVFITVGAYPGHRLQLRCVELSREMFGEVKARVWWEENKSRLHHLYSF